MKTGPERGTAILWHQQDVREALARTGSSAEGLSADEAARRLEEYGPNRLIERKKRTVFMMFLDQFRDFMILVLIAAAVISGMIGDPHDTIAILVIVVLNAVIGFVQEYRAEKAVAALRKMSAPSATVIRSGMPSSVPAADLVPGDMIVLDAGKIVPADLRLCDTVQLRVEEAALTGESVPADKHSGTLHDGSLPLGDRKNMAYKGTFVTYGRGSGVVVGTGMETELGKIAAMLQEETEVKTPLQKRLTVFGRKLAVAVLGICSVVFIFGMLRGGDPLLMLLTAISLAVAAIPEALPAVVTISLALGAKKMVRQNALIRRLPAVETLGSVTYICSDKTGTLTMNRMTVEEVYVDGELLGSNGYGLIQGEGASNAAGLDPRSWLMISLALSNDAQRDAGGGVMGDPTEIALYEAAGKHGFAKEELERQWLRVAEIPFDSQRKVMTTFHKMRDEKDRLVYVSFTKGAFETLVTKSESMLTSAGVAPVDAQELGRINEEMASEGLRVLCVAMRRWDAVPENMSPDKVEADLTVLGLAGLMDPPREEAAEAVSLCKAAGIKPVMITGDHPLTARAIARRLGILGDDQGEMITGKELEGLSPDEFRERVEHISVYARVAPEQKLKIIKGLQDKNQFAAMTGDGVNDAPALRRADIGIAMGITGTDVAKEAAHMILLDDNFATIVKAVKEGRRIFDNIRKFIRYTMTSNTGEIWTIFLAPFLGLPIPLLPIHILWINLVTDGLPGLALAAEPPEKGVMSRPPRPPRESIFAHGLGVQVIWVGLLMGLVSLFTQAWFMKSADGHWQTMVFTVLCLSQMGNVLALRSEEESLFTQGISSNMPLLGAFILTIVLQMATIYVPFLNPIFKTEPLTLSELASTLVLSSIVFFVVEADKLVKRRRAS